MSARAVAIGDTIGGRYVVEGVLGEGGMAVVYRARHVGTGRTCALKVIHPQLTRPQLLEQFVREAQVGAKIGQNPHIVEVFDAGADEARRVPFLAMELLAGQNLESYAETHGPMPQGLLRVVFEQLADALDQAHRAGIVHRDLKPSNLFLTADRKGEPLLKVVDFGIAKALEAEQQQRTATQVGTPSYAAPEQFGAGYRQLAERHGIVISSGISPATDVWAMGLIAYELLTGLPAGQYWGAETLTELPLKVAIGQHEPATARAGANASRLPQGFDAWFARCTRRNAQERWPTAGQAVAELSRLLAGAPLPAGAMETLTAPHAAALRPASTPLTQPMLGEGATASPLVSPPAGAARPSRGIVIAGLGIALGVAGTVAVTRLTGNDGARREGTAVTPPSAQAPVASAAAPVASIAPTAAPTTPAPEDCPAGMAALPGGTYFMGERKDTVTVKGFCMDLTEVTAEAYVTCVKNGQCTADHLTGSNANYGVAARGKHPINFVDWGQATTYCRAQGKRLPTEEEWEWAARGGNEGRTFPWGEAAPDAQLCWSGISKRTGTCAAGSFPGGDTAQGIHDLAGNVWEWTSSNFDDTPAARVARGGCWYDDYPSSVRARLRSRSPPASRNGDLGFRCAR